MKDAHVATNMDYLSGTLQWSIGLVRSANDWEVDILASFYSTLSKKEEEGRTSNGGSHLAKGFLMLVLFTRF
jgi:hypothetical protein